MSEDPWRGFLAPPSHILQLAAGATLVRRKISIEVVMDFPKARQILVRGGALALLWPVSSFAVPPVAAEHGYDLNTYSSNFTAHTVDMNRTQNKGYKWYLFDMYGRKANPAGVRINADGSVTLFGDTTGAVGELASMTPYHNTNAWVGQAFGGGMYVEAVFHYDPAQVTAAHAGGKRAPYPSFWSLPMEGSVFIGANHWPGQAAHYVHDVEVDMFEADYVTKPVSYGVGLHDWYGIRNITCPGLCKVSMLNPSGEREPSTGTNFKQFHTYGFLWVPATNTTKGYMDAYFDGHLIGHQVSWTRYTGQAPTPVAKTWTFGRIDQEHLYFILGTGVGEQYTIKSVNVWQKSAAANLKN
jgi:hypothetical protein